MQHIELPLFVLYPFLSLDFVHDLSSSASGTSIKIIKDRPYYSTVYGKEKR